MKMLVRSAARGLFVAALLVAAGVDARGARLSRHFVIAFDRFVPSYTATLNSRHTVAALSNYLYQNGFDAAADRVSVVAYGLNMANPSLEAFVQPVKDTHGKPVVWRRLTAPSQLSEVLADWPAGLEKVSPGVPYASLQSFAKPYALRAAALPAEADTEGADQTWLLMVTDDMVSGADDDYGKEWHNVQTAEAANNEAMTRLGGAAKEFAQRVNGAFRFIAPEAEEEVELARAGAMPYRIVPYEVRVAERPSLHSVTDLPSPLPLKRVRGGFGIDPGHIAVDSAYRLLDLTVTDARGHSEAFAINANGRATGRRLPCERVRKGDTLTVGAAMRLADGVYNGALLRPVNPDFAAGMTARQAVRLPDEAKVMGVLPLSDLFWWWAPNNVFAAVLVWDLILILIAVALVLFAGYTAYGNIVTYSPSNKVLRLNTKK